MRKYAAIQTELQPHQKRALERAIKGNLILAHGTGSGKTLTAIAAADRLGVPATAFVPAPLVSNFEKEIAKHQKGGPKIDVVSLPTAVSRNYKVPAGNTVIIDEAHSLRNPGTKRSSYVRNQLRNAGRVLALTGTPAYNNIVDWAPLVNLVAKKELVPNNPVNFRNKYIAERQIKAPFLSSLFMNVKPGVVEELTNADQLQRALNPYVDSFYQDVEKPKRIDESIEVPLSDAQEDLYGFVEGKMPSVIKYKLMHDLPPSKQEAKELNAFLTGVRQASNTTQGFNPESLTPEQLAAQSSKLKRAADNLVADYKKDPRFRALVYSNYVESGVNPYTKLLKAQGVPYRIFTGSMTKAEKKAAVDAYNRGEVPVLVGSGSASEGLDLKGTKMIQILEPHFNESRIDQVIGRGIRYKSHADLPPEERKVKVQQYYSTFRKPTGWFGRLFSSPRTSVDTYLKNRAAEKQRMIDSVKDALSA